MPRTTTSGTVADWLGGGMQYFTSVDPAPETKPEKKTKRITEREITEKLIYEVKKIYEINKKNLIKYNRVVPLLHIRFIKSPRMFGKKNIVIALVWGTEKEKGKVIAGIGKIVSQLREWIDHMVFSSDVWYTEHKKDVDMDRLVPPSENPERKEALLVMAFTPDLKLCSTIYSRYNRRIKKHNEVLEFEKVQLIKKDSASSKYILERMVGLTPKVIKSEPKLPIDRE